MVICVFVRLENEKRKRHHLNILVENDWNLHDSLFVPSDTLIYASMFSRKFNISKIIESQKACDRVD